MGRMKQALICMFYILSDLTKTKKRFIIMALMSFAKLVLKSDSS